MKVTILMAIYKPERNWLIEQLKSLNAQTYPKLKMLVWNDCPEDGTDYDAICGKYITKFRYEIFKSNKNLGSNGAFQELTQLAETEYIAYCDQDDIWLPEKISVLVASAKESEAALLCSDMYVIDEKGTIIADSITKVNTRQKFYNGGEKFAYLLSRNFVTGCTTLVKTKLAQKAIPFPKEYIYDWWIAFFAAAKDSIYILERPLIKYRIHRENQTYPLQGVSDKKSYYEKRILQQSIRLNLLCERFSHTISIRHLRKWKYYVRCRDIYFREPNLRSFFKLYKLRSCDMFTTYLELFLPVIPDFIFKIFVAKVHQRKV